MAPPPPSALALPGLDSAVVPLDTDSAKVDLTLELHESTDPGAALEGAIEYDVDLFDASTIERFWRYFTTLATGVSTQPDVAVTE